MKHNLFERSVAFLLALLCVLSLPAVALEQTAAAQQETESMAAELLPTETAEQPSVSAEDPSAPAEQPSAPAEEPAASEEEPSAPAEQPSDAEEAPAAPADPEQVEEAPAAVPETFVEDEKFRAPEELNVLVITVLDEEGQEKETETPEVDEKYTGVVAFYDYRSKEYEESLKEENHDKLTPYFFYYKEGKLQSEEKAEVETDRYLDLYAMPAVDTEKNAVVYTAAEAFADKETKENCTFIFNDGEQANGLKQEETAAPAEEEAAVPVEEEAAAAAEGEEPETIAEPDPADEPVELTAPQLVSLKKNGTNLVLTWKPVEGADKYAIMRAQDGNWQEYAQVASDQTVYTDNGTRENGVKYSYSVCAMSGDDAKGPYATPGLSSITLDAPKLSKVENSGNALKVTWAPVKGAVKYNVYVKANNSKSWASAGSVTTNELLYTQVISGNTYRFTVRAVCSGGISDYNQTGVSVTALAKPAVSRITGQTDGLTVSWNKVPGAASYRLYRKTAKTGWSIVKTLSADKTSYKDTGAKDKNTEYFYTVIADAADKSVSDWDRTGTSSYSALIPKVNKPTCSGNKLTVTWSAVQGSVKYRVFVSTDGGKKWKVAPNGDVTGTTYTYSSAQNGVTYSFAVRGINKSGTLTSYKGSAPYTKLANPVMGKTEINGSGVNVRWGVVSGASAYRVYRREKGSNSWKKVGTVKGGRTSVYLDNKSLKSGTVYYYTAIADSADGCSSSYDRVGAYACYLQVPTPKSAALKAGTGTQFSWNRVTGAAGYLVYRRKGSESWTRIADVSGSVSDYLDKTATSQGYSYTVRAYADLTLENGKKVHCLSDYSSTGVNSALYLGKNGWVHKNGKSYYGENGTCVTGWKYLEDPFNNSGKTFKYYFDEKTGALETNLYYRFGSAYRDLTCRFELNLDRNDDRPSHLTIMLYDGETKTYCIPAISFRVIGNLPDLNEWSETYYTGDDGNSEHLKRWLDSKGSFEQYMTYLNRSKTNFHSVLYGSMSRYNMDRGSYKSLVHNVNKSGGCVRMQCINAFLIQDICRNGYGYNHQITVSVKKSKNIISPFGIPTMETTSKSYDPSDPAITGKFYYSTSIKYRNGVQNISAAGGANPADFQWYTY